MADVLGDSLVRETGNEFRDGAGVGVVVRCFVTAHLCTPQKPSKKLNRQDAETAKKFRNNINYQNPEKEGVGVSAVQF
jgi:hypothetical protein